jgi:ERCC4-type nuclease
MQNSLPDQIHIRIDTQEQRSGIPALLAALRKGRFAPILLLEGDPLRAGHSQMRPESIRGALSYIAAVMRVPILPSSGPADSAGLVYAAAKQCQIGHATRGPAAGRRGTSLPERQMQIVLSLPGIGPVTARALCARFRSLHDLLGADAAQLSTIPGVSPARAAALEQLLHAALPSFDAGGAREA